LKRPAYLIVNEATALLDGAAQGRIMKNILKVRADKGVLWVLRHSDQAAGFQRLLVLKEGRIVDQGKPEEVLARKSSLITEDAAQ
jgi:ABC-type multidrug transport system fused ATPase/permease subunit